MAGLNVSHSNELIDAVGVSCWFWPLCAYHPSCWCRHEREASSLPSPILIMFSPLQRKFHRLASRDGKEPQSENCSTYLFIWRLLFVDGSRLKRRKNSSSTAGALSRLDNFFLLRRNIWQLKASIEPSDVHTVLQVGIVPVNLVMKWLIDIRSFSIKKLAQSSDKTTYIVTVLFRWGGRGRHSELLIGKRKIVAHYRCAVGVLYLNSLFRHQTTSC